MLLRIVKMTFKEENVPSFLKLFEEKKHKIRNFKGCSQLELMKDANDSCVFYTFSKWESEEFLNYYRDSELFVETWTETKSYFSAKPAVFSLKKFLTVDK